MGALWFTKMYAHAQMPQVASPAGRINKNKAVHSTNTPTKKEQREKEVCLLSAYIFVYRAAISTLMTRSAG